MIIADTCLVFHLFNETFLTVNAQKIRNIDPNWVLPSLWREEYANVLSKLARREGRSVEEAVNHLNYTIEELNSCEVNMDTKKALKISLEYKISVYDAHFVALAIDFNAPLVTEDKEIIKNCSNLALSIHDFLKIKRV